MNEGEKLVDELTKPVLDAEAEVEMVVPEESITELNAPTEPPIELTPDFSGFDPVNEAASHAEAIIDAAPVVEELAVEEVAPLPKSRVEGLADERFRALEDERRLATEEALEAYGDEREDELELVEATARQ